MLKTPISTIWNVSGKIATDPHFKILNLLLGAMKPVGGLITLLLSGLYLYDIWVYLAGVKTMDIFENLGAAVKIGAIVAGVIGFLIIHYWTAWQYSQRKKDEEQKFANTYKISLIMSAILASVAGYYFAVAGVGYLLDTVPIEDTGLAVLLLIAIGVGAAMVIDRVIFHPLADGRMDSLRNKAKFIANKAKEFFNANKAAIMTRVLELGKIYGINIGDAKALYEQYLKLKDGKIVPSDIEITLEDFKGLTGGN